MTKFAMVFPGQGSQSVGMLSQLADRYPIVEKTYAQASSVLNYDLWKLVQQGSSEELNNTQITQPALLAASVAIFRVWLQENGPQPALMAGHSLGEYSALVCSGVIDYEDAVKLVELRGKLMQESVPAGVGAMYAIIGLDNEVINQACLQASEGQIVSPVNFNSPGQTVIAGNKEAVERAGALCKEAGAKRALPLSVSVPSHCDLMKPAANKLAEALDKIAFHQPIYPVINNVNVRVEQDTLEIKKALIAQLYSPVRWTETVEYISKNDVSILIEIGPGKVLTGLTKRIVDSLSGYTVNDPTSLLTALESVK